MSTLVADRIGVALGGARVLTDVAIAFRPGRVTALLGPNGAGKSTLLACLAGLRVPATGAATLDGAPVHLLDRRVRARRIGLLPQAQDVHWNVDVETLVGLGRLPWRARGAETEADRAAIARAMAATDVAHFASRGVEHLSGGERSRVLLARVLAGEPEWLLADEPLASLDPAHQLDVAGVLRRIAAQGAGVALVMHDLNLAARIADDAVLLRQGKVVATGAVGDVLTAPLIAKTYDVTAEVGRTAGGERFVLPLARA